MVLTQHLLLDAYRHKAQQEKEKKMRQFPLYVYVVEDTVLLFSEKRPVKSRLQTKELVLLLRYRITCEGTGKAISKKSQI